MAMDTWERPAALDLRVNRAKTPDTDTAADCARRQSLTARAPGSRSSPGTGRTGNQQPVNQHRALTTGAVDGP